jgi:hypothetical protein
MLLEVNRSAERLTALGRRMLLRPALLTLAWSPPSSDNGCPASLKSRRTSLSPSCAQQSGPIHPHDANPSRKHPSCPDQ